MSDILYKLKTNRYGGLAIITLNRPKALNALTHEMILSLTEILLSCQDNDDVQAVIIDSSSDKAFCAGGDVVSLYHHGQTDRLKALSFFYDEYRLNYLIKHFNKPYIPILDGITMGGGVGISLHGNAPVATERFSFAMPETGIGFFPDVGGSHILNQCYGNSGLFLGLTGARISTLEAQKHGLVNTLIDSKQKESFIDTLSSIDLREEPFEKIKECAKLYPMNSLQESIEQYGLELSEAFSSTSISDIFKSLSGINGDKAEKTLRILTKKSPLSLAITFEQLRRSKNYDMKACMQMEYRMVNRFVAAKDFYEGVRALLVDKDKKPIWQHQTINDVTQEEVQSYFEPLDKELELS